MDNSKDSVAKKKKSDNSFLDNSQDSVAKNVFRAIPFWITVKIQ